MSWLHLSLLVLGLWPLYRAWQSTRTTTLQHAVGWYAIAWLGWGCVLLLGEPERPDGWRYLALCLSACPGIAVLGARRPYVAAWNFVVLALLAVLLLPLAQRMLLGPAALDGPRVFFVAATLAIGVLNYLPTCLGPAAVLVGIALWAEIGFLLIPTRSMQDAGNLALALVLVLPWVGWVSWGSGSGSEFDRLWRNFRNRYGLVWGQRVREQFNRAADNAGWKVHLTWFGLDQEASPEMLATLHALLRRFEFTNHETHEAHETH